MGKPVFGTGKEEKRESTLYERLFAKAYSTTLDGKRKVRNVDLATAYRLLLDQRRALIFARYQFVLNADEEREKLAGLNSLVERQVCQRRINRDQGIADSLGKLVEQNPEPPKSAWLPVDTAPLDGRPIRVAGKLDTGAPYIETTRWANIRFQIEELRGYLRPTHWQPLEEMPDE
jgi:hypothetical protein